MKIRIRCVCLKESIWAESDCSEWYQAASKKAQKERGREKGVITSLSFELTLHFSATILVSTESLIIIFLLSGSWPQKYTALFDRCEPSMFLIPIFLITFLSVCVFGVVCNSLASNYVIFQYWSRFTTSLMVTLLRLCEIENSPFFKGMDDSFSFVWVFIWIYVRVWVSKEEERWTIKKRSG